MTVFYPCSLLTRNTFYALLVTSTWLAKLSHLSSHFTDVPPLLLLLYFPTFLLPDVIITVVGRLLFHKASRCRLLSTISAAIGGILAVVNWLAAASQIAFHIETGGEISWASGSNLAFDWGGIQFLLINSGGVGLCALAIAIGAVVLRNLIYDGVGSLLHLAWATVRYRPSIVTGYRALRTDIEDASVESSLAVDQICKEDASRHELPFSKSRVPLWLARIFVLAPIVVLAILQTIRPSYQPYPHMSGTLPFVLSEAFQPAPNEFCLPGLVESMKLFPLPELLSEDKWLPNHNLSPAWHPVANWSTLDSNSFPHIERPHWLPGNDTVPGFERWSSASNDSDHNIYRPELDPLKLSNLDADVLQPIRDSFSSSGKIKHIILLTLESTRADVVPITTHSRLYESILKSQKSSSNFNLSALHSLLANISPVTELLTGMSNSSGLSQHRTHTSTPAPGSWRDRLASKPSSLNILGATTGSTFSLKSLIGSHCGVHAMPVEFAEEAGRTSYQPCLPNIFHLFNRNKKDVTHKPGGLHTASWTPVVVQSMTDQFDRQDRLHSMMGFAPHQTFVKSNLTNPHSKYWPPTEPEVNYFGFPEPQTIPYLRDLFTQVKDKEERLFLSHFTSSTHHPFLTPAGFGEHEEYFGKDGWGKEGAFNKYLNTIRHQDRWLGNIMDLLDEFGMTNETLVVLVGDHGMAFAEDNAKHSNFENPHVSSFRVPLTFQHPALPPLQLSVNATSIQIIPTILDLLLTSDSLSQADAEVAKDILPQYQGQSLIRPLKTEENGRELWTPGIIMTGGAMLVIGSAASPYRLSIPLCKPSDYRFTDISRDPYELRPLTAWSMEELLKKIKLAGYDVREGQRAAKWARDAEKVAIWWSWETKRLWRYSGAAEQLSRGGSGQGRETDGAGMIKKEHWWDT
ncbi:alkaline phosphatase-like protein [Myriangium duriaei CBS 260.36]|uniref:Alkaline phosphatase-like protein n=1 Tax=Myriangium duriaei CBS 260.36 TaxID=1168546 RepID=A0A9P4J5G8_9PEZI|nr:alkaline phosphatase-like protein [Myriangium duriaei CBS 260.36]